MLTAVCMNPAIDRTICVEQLRAGRTNPIITQHDEAGGKGINVARAAVRLGMDARVVGIFGKEQTDFFRKAFSADNICAQVLEFDGATRINYKVFDLSHRVITELNAPGQPISTQIQERLKQTVYDGVEQGSWVALTGSVPPGTPSGFYAEMIQKIHAKGGRVALDADGELLQLGVKESPELIKPNRAELEKLSGKRIATIAEAAVAAQLTASRYGCMVLASLDVQGAVLANATGCYQACPCNVTVHTTVGAGDSMLTGAVAAMEHSAAMPDILAYAIACAASAVNGATIASPDLNQVWQLLGSVAVEQMDFGVKNDAK